MELDHIVHLGILCEHASFRQALGRSLRDEAWIRLVGEADSERGALASLLGCGVDVLVFVAPLAQCCREETFSRLLNVSPRPKILLIALEDNDALALRALKAGVLGVLSKGAQWDELLRAIQQVHEGHRYLSNRLQRAFSDRFVRTRLLESSEERLTKRETEILRLLALGDNHHEIAKKLFISVKTIDTHRSNLLRKLKLRNNADIARFAIRNGLIDAGGEGG